MKDDIERCPECNAVMYERTVKKGSHTGKKGLGCPLCFLLLPEDTPKLKKNTTDVYFFSLDDLKDEDDFKFWTDDDVDDDAPNK